MVAHDGVGDDALGVAEQRVVQREHRLHREPDAHLLLDLGAAHLIELTSPETAIILFSSTSGLLGAPGQAAYAAANAYLDGLSAQYRAAGRDVVSLAWGLWADPTSTLTSDAQAEGVTALATAEALELFDAGLCSEQAVVVAARFDMRLLRAAGSELPPVLRGLVPAAVSPPRPSGTPLDIVRAYTAAVLGHSGADAVDPDSPFTEIGFDSLSSIRLRNRLGEALGIRLPAVVVFDHPTPNALAAHLESLLPTAVSSGPESMASSDPSEVATPTGPPDVTTSSGPLGALYRAACREGRIAEATEFLASAARLRPKALAVTEPGRLTDGPSDAAELVCVPSLTALSGPHQYSRFAAAMRGERIVSALSLPGFAEGEPGLPSTLDGLADMAADAVRSYIDRRPHVLVGYSSGGWLAHAIATRLVDDGGTPPPLALVLLDTFLPREAAEPVFRERMVATMLDREDADLGMISDNRLTAMAGYLSLFTGWTPDAMAPLPTLFVRANSDIAPGHKAQWPQEHEPVITTGNHFTMIEGDSLTTAHTVNSWLTDHISDTEGAI